MPSKKHYYEPGAVYHLMLKCENDEFLLDSDNAKQEVLDTIVSYRTKHGYKIAGYCLMGNHVHVVVVTGPRSTPSDIMRAWKGWSSRRLQATLGRKGGIWKDRYSDNIIMSMKELLGVLEYIHNNPVKAGIVSKATDYRWSSAREYADEATDVRIVDKGRF